MAERRRLGRLAVGAGVTAAAVAGAMVAERLAVRRLRARPDPEAGEDFGALPPDDLGPVLSFDGTPLAVRAAGPADAPPIVFAHGFSLDMTTWHYQWPAFSDRYRCVLFDHRGHGRSGRPPSGDHSIVAMGQDWKAVLDAAAPDRPATLVGHSMGGMSILTYARRHPQDFARRVGSVVLVDTAASDILRELLGGLGARAGGTIRRLGARLAARPEEAARIQRLVRRFGADLSFLVAWITNFGPGASPSMVDHVTRVAVGAPPEVWIHTVQDFLDLDLREALRSVTVPTLVVVGDRDLITPKTSAAALREALPDARAVVITRAGHMTMLEQHAVFDEVLEDHLARVAEPGGRRRTATAR